MPHAHHDHDHDVSDVSSWAFIIAIVANLAFTIVQASFAVIAHSSSLLADAGHNLGDVLGLVLAWIAMLLLRKKASTNFSYGLKKTTILASITNSLILVATCAIIAVDAIEKFMHPGYVQAEDIMIVAAIGIVVNAGTALLFVKGSKDDLNIKGAFLHLAFDALVSFGVVIAGGLILLTHQTWIDPVAGLMIVAVILYGTFSLLRDSLKLVMDGVPTGIDSLAVKRFLESAPGVIALHDLHIWALSTKENALTAHLICPNGMTDAAREKLSHTLSHDFKIHHTTIQVETQENHCVQSKHC
jgi:cobalt-zinc-cadmium efflux system protein